MAEAVFSHKVRLAGLNKIVRCDSAGTGGWYMCSPPHPGTQAVLKQRQIPFEHLARHLEPIDLVSFDYILAMDCSNLAYIRKLGPGGDKARLLMEYAPDVGEREVPDPYYTGEFERVYQLIDRATDGLLAAIRRERGL